MIKKWIEKLVRKNTLEEELKSLEKILGYRKNSFLEDRTWIW